MPKDLIARRSFEPLIDQTRYHLRIYATGRSEDGKQVLSYRFSRTGYCPEILFAGDDYRVPNGWSKAQIVNGLMGYLTLRPGDTDPEYFDKYTDRQLAFAKSYACEIIWAITSESERKANL